MTADVPTSWLRELGRQRRDAWERDHKRCDACSHARRIERCASCAHDLFDHDTVMGYWCDGDCECSEFVFSEATPPADVRAYVESARGCDVPLEVLVKGGVELTRALYDALPDAIAAFLTVEQAAGRIMIAPQRVGMMCPECLMWSEDDDVPCPGSCTTEPYGDVEVERYPIWRAGDAK